MRFLGACVGMVSAVVVAAAGGAGCNAGSGMLAGAGGGGILSGVGGKAAGGRGGASVLLGFAGAGPATGTAGYPDNGCGAVMPAYRVPPKIMIVLDTSASMNDAADGSCTGNCGVASKWAAAVSGIDAVVGSSGLPVDWGLEFIGGDGNNCYIGGIAVAAAPGSGSAVTTALASRTAAGALTVTGSTPARVAMNAAADHLLGRIAPGDPAIVLMIDGLPDCDLGEPNAGDVAGTLDAIAFTRTEGIPTFVVGVGAVDAATDDALSMMAFQGGVPRVGAPAYYPVADASDVVDTINQVVAATGACTFAIPPPLTNDGVTSRDDISVLADGKAIPQDFSNGWAYSDNTHTTLTLHGSSCEAVRAGTLQQVAVVFQCLI